MKNGELIEYMEACALIARNGADIHPQSKELRHHADMVTASVAALRATHEPPVEQLDPPLLPSVPPPAMDLEAIMQGRRAPIEHDLKVWQEVYPDLESELKNFEFRRSDRPF